MMQIYTQYIIFKIINSTKKIELFIVFYAIKLKSLIMIDNYSSYDKHTF